MSQALPRLLSHLTQPFDSNQKTWPLYYITPLNKLFFCKPYVCIRRVEENHFKDYSLTSASQQECFFKELDPSLVLKQEICFDHPMLPKLSH